MTPTVREPDMPWLLFSPSGRVGRQVFILAWLFWMLLDVGLATKLALVTESGLQMLIWLLLFSVIATASLVSAVMLSIKRLHDMGFPAPFALLLFVPGISAFALIVFCVWPSVPDANAFGPRPNWPQG